MAKKIIEATNDCWLQQLRPHRAVTRFEPRLIPEPTLEEILTVGCGTPSPWNLQPWQFIVVRSEEKRAEILRHCLDSGPAPAAPVLVVALADPSVWKRAPARLAELAQRGLVAPGEEAAHLDTIHRHWSAGVAARILAIARTHAAVQEICLAALACKLGCGWIQDFDAEALQRVLRLPDHLVLVGVLAMGYAAAQAELPTPPLGKMLFAEAYGLPWEREGRETET